MARGRIRRQPGDDAGLAVITVMLMVVALTLVVLTLLQLGLAQYRQSSRSEDGLKAQSAAEAGLNAYLAKLVQLNSFDTNYLQGGEATRSSDQTCDTTDPANPATLEVTSVIDDSAQNARIVAIMSTNNGLGEPWYHPCGFDVWAPVDPSMAPGLENYEYSLAVFPRSGNDLRIVAAGRRADGNTDMGAVRVLEVVVRPSSFAEYQMISQSNIVVQAGTETRGKVYSTGTVDHRGTVFDWVIGAEVVGCNANPAFGAIGCNLNGNPADWSNAPDLASCDPPQPFFVAGLPDSSCHNRDRAGVEPAWNNIPLARQAVRDKVLAGGGLHLAASSLSPGYDGFRVVLTPGNPGTIVAYECRTEPGTDEEADRAVEWPSGWAQTRGPATSGGDTIRNEFEASLDCNTSPVATGQQTDPFFVYSDAPITIEGFVTAKGNIVSDADIYLADDIYYGSDTNETEDDLNSFVLGAHAYGEIIIPAWVDDDLQVRGAFIAEEGSYHDAAIVEHGFHDSATCKASLPLQTSPTREWLCQKDTLTFRGSWYSKKTADVLMFDNRIYEFYEQLKALAPPLWPNATNSFDVVSWRERTSNYDVCQDEGFSC
ncbi:MAG: hypothetical protein IT198_11060 [Acidimicrobiia bacterium]|nr:hypothetical protein [Acidimicrobiia bacterium]